MVGFIYKYENRINHKVYIGQTTDLVNRRAAHRYKAAFVVNKFYNAVRKYGWENFDFDVLYQVEADTVDKITELLDLLEEKYIKEYDSFHNGYNSTGGGHCYRGKEVSEEFREFCRNRTYSEETRRKFSMASRNRLVSEATRKKLSDTAKKKHFENHWKNSSEKRDANRRRALSKPILQIDKEGNIVNTFQTNKEAALFLQESVASDRKLGAIRHGIQRHCTNATKKRYYYGFEWKFEADV